MIEDAARLSTESLAGRAFDVCIVGSGPAGITLARRLAVKGLSVGLFEAGGLEPTEELRDAYRGPTVGRPEYFPLDECRLRYFGGSSNHWGGWTRPLDAYDFIAKPHHPLAEWPIGERDLAPYAENVTDILNLPPVRRPPDLFIDGEPDLLPRMFWFSVPPTNFSRKFRSELDASEKITVYLNANLIDLRLDENRRAVTEAVFRTFERSETFSVTARAFVLCLGGLENPRALLNADSQIAGGIGNENDLVGRTFMEHPHAPVGKVVLRQAPTWMLVYSPTPEFMQTKRILNFGMRISQIEQWYSGHFTGALEREPPCTAGFDAILAAALKGDPPPCPAHVADAFVACEQELVPENRVRLIAQRDRLGLRRIELDWRLSEMDFRTLLTAATHMAERLAATDRGRMQIVDWLLAGETPTAKQLWGGNHHMGTTRMSDDPKRGVVDANARVHSVENLYCGGSSVFASSGHANPTYTIVQLALRLGDHLGGKLRGR